MTGLSASIASAAGWAAAGVLAGIAYFAMVRRTAELLGANRGRVMPAVLTLGRFAGVTLFLAAAARWGAVPLLSAFAGLLVARGVALRGTRRAA